MNKEQAKVKIAEIENTQEILKRELVELKEIVESSGKLELWRPTALQKYHYVNAYGRVVSGQSYEQLYIDGFYKVGNCFKTQEDAEYYAKRWSVRQKFERLSEVANGRKYGFVQGSGNYIIYYDYKKLCFEIDIRARYRGAEQYFNSREAAQRVLDVLTDEEKVILFGGYGET